jgi:hypothetical protein
MQTPGAVRTDKRLSEAKRKALLGVHPIVEREYTIPTPMLLAAYAIARERVWTRRTGIVFFGKQRIGKTKCAEEMQRLLRGAFPKSYVLMVYARRVSRANDGHMYRLILEAAEHVLAARKDPELLYKNALTDVELEVAKRKGTQFVLIIDEAQLLNDTDLQQLVVFHNALARNKIKMTTISFAQPEILHRRTALMATKQTQIIARFLSEPIEFQSCTGPEELVKLLEAYDEHSDFPEGSGWSYTRFFLPLAFENGLRLKHFARRIWDAVEYSAGSTPDSYVPMEHLCLVIEELLLKLRKEDCETLTISEDDIAKAVDAANLESFRESMESIAVAS